MNYTSGTFQCPKCKEGSFKYKKWKKRNIYFENHIINDWIFYESSEVKKDYNFFNYLKGESVFKCFCELDYCNNCDSFRVIWASILTLLSPVFGILLIGLYITILSYIDCFSCCCEEKAPMTKCCIETLKDIYCCKCNFFESIKKEDFCIVLKKIYLYFISIFLFIFYFLIYIWIDLYIYYKGKKRNKIYKNVFGQDIQIKNIWESNISRKEPDLYKDKEELKRNFTCKNCGFIFEDFKTCIPQNSKIKITIENDDDKSTQEELNPKNSRNISDKNITIYFTSGDFKFNNYPIVCQKNDQFNEVINKLFQIFPEYKNKNIYFVCNSRVVKENKTISENGISNDNAILIVENVLK